MNASISVEQLPARILFLCRNESSVRMDAKSLRALGISSLAYKFKAADAVEYLEKERIQAQNAALAAGMAASPLANTVDIVVCEEQMECAPASVFLYALAQHPALNGIPVLVLAGSGKSASLYRSAGIHVLERPYTSEQLSEAVRLAMSSAGEPLNPKAFEQAAEKGLSLIARERAHSLAASKGPVTTTDLYRQGMTLLRKQEYEAARGFFTRVLERQEDHLEACLALARTYQGEQNTEGVRGALLRAAAVCLRRDDRARAAHISAMLPIGMRNNIFAHEALVRMREGEYRAAALSFLEAGKAQSDQPLHRLIARACLQTTNPEEYMAKICEALEGLGHTMTASALRRRLLEYPEFNGAGGRATWLDRYPRLKEAVSVASYAAWAWKQA